MTCFPLSPTFTAGGESWDALVPVTYVNPGNGQFLNVTVEVDTGAVYSLAPLSLATILGLSPTSGTPISLEGVGGQAFTAYLHSITLEIDGVGYDGFLVAIASSENVPFLIGRTNFWNLASIRIDDLNHQICIDALPGAGSTVTQPSSSVAPIVISALGFAGALAVFYFLVKA